MERVSRSVPQYEFRTVEQFSYFQQQLEFDTSRSAGN
jgi:hypothetical protein